MISRALPDDFKKLIDTKEYKVIDIRTPQELEYFWVIPWMDMHFDFYTQLDEILNLDKNQKYLIYCYHGNRTWILLQYMKEQGFKNVIDLIWGTEARVNAWFNLIPYKS